MKKPLSILVCAMFVWIPVRLAANEPAVDPEDLPRVAATPPDEAVGTFEVKDGFRLDLVAAEPLLVDPVAIAFDKSGRMFVAEMVDYSERREERLGRIRLLEDTNGDGHFDESRVFVDDLAWPTAIICYDGGIFVGATPDILWLKDTDGDGRADERKKVFTGFGAHSDRLNVQALLNNFHWGIDNRIHGATSRNGGMIESLEHPSDPVLDLRSRDFSFDPRTLKIRAEAGGGQHGLSFDNRGRKFVCSNSHHLQALMYEGRYAGRNPHYTPPSGLVDIAVDGPAAEVFRISPDEPWRIIRTKWRVEGTVPGIVEGGGRVSGYFTGATGATIYRGNALPESFLENAFIGDAGGNLVHRKIVRTDGVALSAERPEDERDVEFIASSDVWFRPVDFANAPDGGLYILDMYREVIEHPWSIPESIKEHLDLNSGNDRGRIYRVVPEDFEQPEEVRLGEATTSELVATLGHTNGWHRDTAARLLFEQRDPGAVPLLEDYLQNSKSGLGRMHALYSLDGFDALEPMHLLSAMNDADERVRQHGVRLSEKFFSEENTPHEDLVREALALSEDESPLVRYQLAFSLGELEHPERARAMAEILRRDFDSEWVQAALLSSLKTGADELFQIVSVDPMLSEEPAGRRFLGHLIEIIAATDRPGEIERVVEFLETLPPQRGFFLIFAFGSSLEREGRSLGETIGGDALERVMEVAREVAAASDKDAQLRRDAIRILGLGSYEESGEGLLGLLDSRESREVQLAALGALDRFGDEAIGQELIDRWEIFTPRIRSEALAMLLKRREGALLLLKAIAEGPVRIADLSSTQVDFLKTNRDETIRESAARVLESEFNQTRREAVDAFSPALGLSGNAERGKARFAALCASCHRAGETGHELGPDVTTLKASGRESLLLNIVDPNREVAPNYLTYLIETTDGESHLGVIANETSRSVTLRQPFGMETIISRDNIARMESQGRSMMPEGLEGALDRQGMADLLEYILSTEGEK